MKKIIFRILLVAGILPLALPILLGFYKMSIESWTMADWLIMYSFLYWPTYLAGLILIIVSSVMLIKLKTK